VFVHGTPKNGGTESTPAIRSRSHTMYRQPYIAAYDITRNSLRRAALRLLRAYATGGQKSVHEVWLTPAEKRAVLGGMEEILDDGDRFMLLRLDPRSPAVAIGRGQVPSDPDYFYIG
jgi:CRISPR-associated protein Cas2